MGDGGADTLARARDASGVGLTAMLEREGRLAEAASAAERALEISPCDETLFRNLVRLLIVAENSVRAAVVAFGFLERLALDLGVPPSAETMRLVREVRGERNPARM